MMEKATVTRQASPHSSYHATYFDGHHRYPSCRGYRGLGQCRRLSAMSLPQNAQRVTTPESSRPRYIAAMRDKVTYRAQSPARSGQPQEAMMKE